MTIQAILFKNGLARLVLAAALLVLGTVGVRAQTPGDTDPTFGAGQVGATRPGAVVFSVAIQGDGRVLVAGEFTEADGVIRGRIARLNADGALDATFGAGQTGANGQIDTVVVQPDGKILIGGLFTRYNGETRNNIARLNADGTLDTTFGAGQTGGNGRINSVAVQPDGKILIAGNFTQINGASRGRLARLNPDGTVDATFGDGLSGANLEVREVVIQPDGKILIGGAFGTFNGVARPRLARLNADGTVDTSLTANFGGGLDLNFALVIAIELQPDGKIIIGGRFTRIGSVDRNNIARLNADGTLDATFGNGLTGVNQPVNDLIRQPDGRIVMVGDFSIVNGVERRNIARLNSDGTLDATFVGSTFALTLPTAPTVQIFQVARQADGRMIVGGNFSLVNGVGRDGVARLNTDGSLAGEFVPPNLLTPGVVNDLSPQPDGKVVIGGQFTRVNGVTRNNIARLTEDGALDANFGAGQMGANGPLERVAVQADGRILIGGNFSSYNGTPLGNIARLNADGTLDPTFGNGLAGTNDVVLDILVEPDGKVVIVGDFTQVNGVTRNRVARLNPDGTLDATFGAGQTGADVRIIRGALQLDGKILLGGDLLR